MTTANQRLQFARLSLTGLSIGDALGKLYFTYFGEALPTGIWRYTDDTVMGCAIVDMLEKHQLIEPNDLAQLFASNFRREPDRGYGAVAHFILHNIAQGVGWQDASTMVYGGTGSMGNGAAMRAAPIGAYFFDQPTLSAEQAMIAARITHAHPDGQAGCVAVAVAAALFCQSGQRNEPLSVQDSLQTVIQHLEDTPTRQNLRRALALGWVPIEQAAEQLGTGIKILANDTVPFALWFALHHQGDYEQAIWTLLRSMPGPESDVDTLGAIVGSLLSLQAPTSIPPLWLQRTETTHHSALCSTHTNTT